MGGNKYHMNRRNENCTRNFSLKSSMKDTSWKAWNKEADIKTDMREIRKREHGRWNFYIIK
jgi:hypothetical protein